jgi:hypothetical protein
MENIQLIISKKLQKHKLVRVSSAELIRKIIKDFIKEDIKIIFKNNTIYIKNLSPHKKFEIYIHKKNLLEKIQKKIEKY